MQYLHRARLHGVAGVPRLTPGNPQKPSKQRYSSHIVDMAPETQSYPEMTDGIKPRSGWIHGLGSSPGLTLCCKKRSLLTHFCIWLFAIIPKIPLRLKIPSQHWDEEKTSGHILIIPGTNTYLL